MIDLESYDAARGDCLPWRLVVDGEDVPIVTDFRAWLQFQRKLAETRLCWPGVFPGGAPDGDWQTPALEFLHCANRVPKSRPRGERMLDMLEDSDYLVASFQAAYGIDLTSCSMHWHRFLALLRGLPGDSKMAEIMGYRSMGRERKPEQARREAREAWALPGEDDETLLEMQRRMFGGVTDG